MNSFQSSWDVKNLNNHASWDKTPTLENKTSDASNAPNPSKKLLLQLLGVVGILLLILATVLPLTFVLTGIKTTTTKTARIAKSSEVGMSSFHSRM
ncbi:unnamed protein product [Rotaria sordida]|uniref:Uncharacterized protein n=1 Tax=Rotaria sordida TaxID=392033 RepID=A0A813R7M4_9BILA|nr:unnamed protein product [Rotaria sordida]